MACGSDAPLLNKLRSLIHDIEGGGCCPPSCGPCGPPCGGCPPACSPGCVPIPPITRPYATCTMVVPPPILPPTNPQPVKPLRMPCAACCQEPEMSQEEQERLRYANFYNNYNIDFHRDPCEPPFPDPRQGKCQKGVTIDGQNACCEDYMPKPNPACKNDGCPTGFKPCTMKLSPPCNLHPCGVWCAEIQPCPPKPKKKVSKYEPTCCKRPCCKHWKPKEGDCKYDDPCKAACFNHPPGMKPKKRISCC